MTQGAPWAASPQSEGHQSPLTSPSTYNRSCCIALLLCSPNLSTESQCWWPLARPLPATPREDVAQGSRGPAPGVRCLIRSPVSAFPRLTCCKTGLIQVPWPFLCQRRQQRHKQEVRPCPHSLELAWRHVNSWVEMYHIHVGTESVASTV